MLDDTRLFNSDVCTYETYGIEQPGLGKWARCGARFAEADVQGGLPLVSRRSRGLDAPAKSLWGADPQITALSQHSHLRLDTPATHGCAQTLVGLHAPATYRGGLGTPVSQSKSLDVQDFDSS